ncbi:ribonuclease HII [Pullulanibacillus camelliae]|uniref:Ribonuclease HII n=1 Tax=Pullulanibacillus camelliae TaxID=1707096 RepID=A0A8J2VPF8_9BACL|nr:ribonuclease HII [Pullulanibacillus camelliae]GGE42015.1 ribonuclease HII [Pullulanibacillus camelliae]
MRSSSIKDIASFLEEKHTLTIEEREQLESDERKGVKALLTQWEKRQAKQQVLIERYERMLSFEEGLYDKGYAQVAGIDEAGRGPLAGPVVAAAVILDREIPIIGVNDSKQLSRKQRQRLYEEIQEKALAVGVGLASSQEIDTVNIYQATKLAMQRAVQHLEVKPSYLLVDAMTVPLNIKQHAITKGDARSVSIASASIIAKETRDRMMEALDERYPGYAFTDHHGYGTKAHLEAIARLGPCPEHRKSFSPIKEWLK